MSGPTTAISIVVFATISPLAEPGTPEYVGLVLTLTLLVGVFQLALGLLRMGALVNFVSHTVVIGFTAGAAVLIAASQVKNFFGIEIARGSSVWQVLMRPRARRPAEINLYVAVGRRWSRVVGEHRAAQALAAAAAAHDRGAWWPAAWSPRCSTSCVRQ